MYLASKLLVGTSRDQGLVFCMSPFSRLVRLSQGCLVRILVDCKPAGTVRQLCAGPAGQGQVCFPPWPFAWGRRGGLQMILASYLCCV